MASASKLILLGVIMVPISFVCDVAVRRQHPMWINGDIGYSVALVMLMPMLGSFVHFSRKTWNMVRVATVLLAIPLGLWISPPMGDFPAAGEWNVPLGIFHFIFLVAAFLVAFLLIRIKSLVGE
jgi:hypothetical protein